MPRDPDRRYGRRDTAVAAVCNWLLRHVATDHYEAAIGGAVRRGLDAVADDVSSDGDEFRSRLRAAIERVKYGYEPHHLLDDDAIVTAVAYLGDQRDSWCDGYEEIERDLTRLVESVAFDERIAERQRDPVFMARLAEITATVPKGVDDEEATDGPLSDQPVTPIGVTGEHAPAWKETT